LSDNFANTGDILENESLLLYGGKIRICLFNEYNLRQNLDEYRVLDAAVVMRDKVRSGTMQFYSGDTPLGSFYSNLDCTVL
jgi:hypothetical protein